MVIGAHVVEARAICTVDGDSLGRDGRLRSIALVDKTSRTQVRWEVERETGCGCQLAEDSRFSSLRL